MNPETKAATITTGVGIGGASLGVFIVWLCGNLGLDMSAEVGAVVGGASLGAGAAIGTYGIVGCLKILLFGKNRQR